MGTPYCIVAQLFFGYLRTMKVPEARIPHVTKYGWSVLIRDSEMANDGDTFSWRDLQRGPQRKYYRDEDYPR